MEEKTKEVSVEKKEEVVETPKADVSKKGGKSVKATPKAKKEVVVEDDDSQKPNVLNPCTDCGGNGLKHAGKVCDKCKGTGVNK